MIKKLYFIDFKLKFIYICIIKITVRKNVMIIINEAYYSPIFLPYA